MRGIELGVGGGRGPPFKGPLGPPWGGSQTPQIGDLGSCARVHTKRPLLSTVQSPLGKSELSDTNRVQNTVLALCVKNDHLTPPI